MGKRTGTNSKGQAIKLPDGWISTSLGEVVKPANAKVDPREMPDSPYLSLKHIESNTTRIVGQGVGRDVKSTKSIFKTGDVLYGKLRPYLNKVCIPSFDGICSTDILVFSRSDYLDNRFLMRFLTRPEVVVYANHNMSGVQLPRISFKKLAKVEFLLPPRVEQERIANKVEELLSIVGKDKDHLEKIQAILENFRKAVLDAACTGKLTEDWREGKNTKDWTETSVKDVVTKIQYGYTASSVKNIAGPRFLRITDIQKGKVNWDDVPSCKIDKRHIMKYQLETGDIVFARTGATTGKSFLIKECPLSIFASYLIRVKPNKKKILPEYLYIFFQSDSYWEQIAGKLSGSAQSNCNATKLSNLELFLPPLLEQAEITDLVEMLFELADKFEVRIKEAREKVVRITHSILAKAFRGELVPTEAELARIEGRDYETAKELLARVAKAKTAEANDKEKKKMKEQFTVKHKKQPARRPLIDVIYENPKGITPENLLRIANYTIEEIDDFYYELSNIMQEIEEVKPSGSQAKKWLINNNVLIKPKKV